MSSRRAKHLHPTIALIAVILLAAGTSDAAAREAADLDLISSSCRSTDDDGDGATECAGECDDSTAAIRPGATERCDGIDNDCDGMTDEPERCRQTCETPEVHRMPIDLGLVGGSAGNSLVWGGTEYALASTSEIDDRSEVVLARFDASGRQVGGSRQITSAAASSFSPTLARTGDGYGLAWVDTSHGNSEIYFIRLDRQAESVGEPIRITIHEADSRQPSLAWDGSGFGLAWTDSRLLPFERYEDSTQIYFVRLDRDGRTIGDVRRVTAPPDDIPWYHEYDTPDLIWDGERYVVSWNYDWDDNHRVRVTWLDRGGTPVQERTVTARSDVGNQARATWTGQVYGLLWHTPVSSDGGFMVLDPDGTIIADLELPANQSDVIEQIALTWTGHAFEAVLEYKSALDAEPRLELQRFDERGMLDGDPIRLSDDVQRSSPAIAWSGTRLGATWIEHDENARQRRWADIGCDSPASTLTYISVSRSQFFPGIGTVPPQTPLVIDAAGAPARLIDLGGLSSLLNVNAMHIGRSGRVVFSVDRRGFVRTPSGALVLEPSVPYEFDESTAGITPLPDGAWWRDSVGDLDAIALLDDGSIVFSIATNRLGRPPGAPSIYLRQQNAYRFDPATGSIELYLDGTALGLPDLDAIAIDAEQRLAFSTASETFAAGTRIHQNSVYRVNASGHLEEVLSGREHGVRSVDALSYE